MSVSWTITRKGEGYECNIKPHRKIMLTEKQKDRLKANWGTPAESMECMAEIRLYDSMSSWHCYLLAMSPEDEDDIYCLINGEQVEASPCSLKHILSMYNAEGEHLELDKEYRPRKAVEIYRKLVEILYAT